MYKAYSKCCTTFYHPCCSLVLEERCRALMDYLLSLPPFNSTPSFLVSGNITRLQSRSLCAILAMPKEVTETNRPDPLSVLAGLGGAPCWQFPDLLEHCFNHWIPLDLTLAFKYTELN